MAFRYSDEQWQAVLDIVTKVQPPPTSRRLLATRLRLERAAGWFLEAVEYRSKRKLTAKADRRALEQQQRIHGFSDLKKHAADLLEAFSEHQQRHSRRNDPQKEMFYFAVLEVWAKDFKQPVRFSRSSAISGTHEPRGPCIRFLDAALRPVMLDATPSPEGLKEVIRHMAFLTPDF